MMIAIDYDNTYIKDVALWERFIEDAVMSGHDITMVTARHHSDCLLQEDDYDVIYCNGRNKRHCFKADVWIDHG